MIYTDYLWYEQLGFQSILLKEVFTKLILIFSGWFIASSFLRAIFTFETGFPWVLLGLFKEYFLVL